ncbi:MAG TPA: ABC transporter ATP-binding protein [Rhizomicrobium sp.]|jgi:lipopolysaccharide transport system ATP-binding protein
MNSGEIVVAAQALGKAYRLHARARDRVKHGLFGRNAAPEDLFWALRNLDLELRRGEALGVIGENGAGKSTLLRLLCGTLRPTTGSVTISGRVAALLELGSGFNPKFTGRENVWLSAAVHGLSKAQIAERFDAIADFAGIGEFIDLPVKMYSSGMQARLAFAVSAHVDADILIVDEILAVGDAAFAQKCGRYFEKFRERGTLLFVSHNSGLVARLCDRALWLEHGESREIGPAAEVCANYITELAERVEKKEAAGKVAPASRWKTVEPPSLVNDPRTRATNSIGVSSFNTDAPWHGHGGAVVTDVYFCDGDGQRLDRIEGGNEVHLHIACRADRDLPAPIIGFLLRDRLGQNVFGDSTYFACRERGISVRAGEMFVAKFTFQMPLLANGTYAFTVAITEGTQEDHIHVHWIEEAVLLTVTGTPVRLGLIGIPARSVRIDTIGAPPL